MSSMDHSSSASIQMSLDGYIRMTFEAFSRLKFIHKMSWEDVSLTEDLLLEGVQASCSGYCEWVADETSRVSIGWAWFDLLDGRRFIAPGGISSNVMLVTGNSCDLGMNKTSELLCAWLSSERWQIRQNLASN